MRATLLAVHPDAANAESIVPTALSSIALFDEQRARTDFPG